jgi:hypothetical protein
MFVPMLAGHPKINLFVPMLCKTINKNLIQSFPEAV